MSSGCIPATHHVFFSTHNALANGVDRDGEEKLTLRVTQLGRGKESSIKFSAYPFYDIEMVKRLIIKRLALPPSTNISELRVFQRGSELPNYRSLSAFSNTRTKLHFYWSFRDSSRSIGIRTLELRAPPLLESLLGEVNLGLQRGINPKLTMDGTGGTYMLFNSKGQRVAMFKPRDEEAFAPNNPRSYEGQLGQKGFRSGVFSGEGASREVAAFLLDAQHGGLAGVPQTTKVEARHLAFCHKTLIKSSGARGMALGPGQTFWKEGSLQEYVDARDTCGDYDPRVFAVSDAHHIGILDITVLNLDRNDGNILVTSRPLGASTTSSDTSKTPDGKLSKFRLVPIDHGLILPDTMDVGDVDLVWFRWPHSQIPFSSAELRHIFSLDSDKDAHRLGRKLEIREECLRTMRVTTRLLQIGAKMHLNLYQIASLLVRLDDFEQPSIMERAVRTALAQAYTAVSASALVNQSRLGGGSLFIDLHLAEGKGGNCPETTSAPVLDAERRQTRAVTFSATSCNMAPLGDDVDALAASPEMAAATQQCSTSKAASKPSKTSTFQHLLKLPGGGGASTIATLSTATRSESGVGSVVTATTTSWEAGSTSSWESSSSSSSAEETSCNSPRAAQGSENSSDEFAPHLSRISGVPLADVPPSSRRAKKKGISRKKVPTTTVDHPPPPVLQQSILGESPRTSPSPLLHQDVQPASLQPPPPPPPPSAFPPPNAPPTSRALADSANQRKKSDVYDSKAIAPTATARTGTAARRRPTALFRRTTNSRLAVPTNSTWTLMDSHKRAVAIDWGDPLFERTFFECFELIIRHHILEAHPNWKSYPFNGYELLLPEVESSSHKKPPLPKDNPISTRSPVLAWGSTLSPAATPTSSSSAASHC